jgi:hypothetical protein
MQEYNENPITIKGHVKRIIDNGYKAEQIEIAIDKLRDIQERNKTNSDVYDLLQDSIMRKIKERNELSLDTARLYKKLVLKRD